MADISRIALSTVQVAWKNIAEDIAGGQTSSAAEDGRPFAEGLEQDLKNLVVAANVVIALNESASTRLRAELHSFIRGSLTANGCLGPHTHTHHIHTPCTRRTDKWGQRVLQGVREAVAGVLNAVEALFVHFYEWKKGQGT
jgi:hypothetical protein